MRGAIVGLGGRMPEKITAVISCMMDAERPFIRAALESVVNQTMPCAARVYVADTNDWIANVTEGLEQVVVRPVPMMPVAAIRNIGVKEANSDLVAFLDGDDFWFPAKTERQVAALQQNAVDFAGADHVLVDEAGSKFAYGTARYIPMPSSWLVRRDLMLEYPFNERVRLPGEEFHEDVEWWMRTAEKSQRIRVSEFLVAYRVRQDSLSSGCRGRRRKETVLRAAQVRGLRPLTLAASFVLNWLHRDSKYADHNNRSKHSNIKSLSE